MPDWDEEADVVVVGFGSAGVAASITAADAGARVLLLEKLPAGRHTPTSKMGGSFFMTVTDVDAATRYLDHCAGGMIPTEVNRRWAELASTLDQWVLGLGTKLELSIIDSHLSRPAYPHLDGADAIVTYLATVPGTTGKMGVEWFDELAGAVDRRPAIDVRWSTAAEKLVRDADGRVYGVEATASGGPRRIGARNGVVLATGGFEFDDHYKRNYLRARPIHFAGNPGNTGDGHRMAQAVGADLWHMNVMEGRFVGHFALGDGMWVNVQPNLNPPGYLVIDRFGHRFSNEHRYTLMETYWYEAFHYDGQERGYVHIPFYWFFDSRRMAAGPLTPLSIGQPAVGLYDWSDDNSVEVDRGWIHTADSIEKVAELVGIEDPTEAARSVARYNAGCASGTDEYGRPAASLVPVDSPPYYCVELYPGGAGTAGGPRHDELGRVLDPFDDPIPGLYAAGSVGQMIGDLYPSSGAGFSDALGSGIIAGESVARRR